MIKQERTSYQLQTLSHLALYSMAKIKNQMTADADKDARQGESSARACAPLYPRTLHTIIIVICSPMLTVAIFTIAREWKPPIYQLMNA